MSVEMAFSKSDVSFKSARMISSEVVTVSFMSLTVHRTDMPESVMQVSRNHGM